MTALSRSFHRVSLKIFSSSGVLASLPAALKSGTASLTRSTPRPVPVRIQSWAQRLMAKIKMQKTFFMIFPEKIIDGEAGATGCSKFRKFAQQRKTEFLRERGPKTGDRVNSSG